MEVVREKVVWRCVKVDYGELSVMIYGTAKMHRLSARIWNYPSMVQLEKNINNFSLISF